MQVLVDVPEAWEAKLAEVARRMGTDDYSEAFGRALSLADVVTYYLQEQGAWVEFHSPALGDSELVPSVLYGGRGLPVPQPDTAVSSPE
jgi:hypothetical protein